jgi:signal transduction histidine kinase
MIGTAVDVTAERQAALVLARDRAELEGPVEARTAELMRAAEERRRAEEAARQAEKLAALGQLTGGVAHDFNNLLQVVASGATLLKRPGLSEARRTAILDGMASACQNARELTSRLLSFARRQTLRPQLLDLNGRLDGMAELLRRTLGATVRLETRFAADLWPVLADPGQLEVALLNLAVNARDAMPEGGTMRIETRNATLPPAAERAAGDYVCLTVSDTGEGMTPAVLARAVEPFFTTKENGRGTRLGLPQVFGFAKQSGGDIEVRSAPGQGTTVTLHLPRAATGSERERPLASGAVLDALRSSAGRTVLVVDDNAAAAGLRGGGAGAARRGIGVRGSGHRGGGAAAFRPA